MAQDPSFTATPIVAGVSISTANTNRDGTGTLGTVLALATSSAGVRVERVTITATGTTTAGVVRLFINDATTTRLFEEVIVPAITPSTTVKVFRAEVVRDDGMPLFVLPAGYTLYASTNNAEGFAVQAIGGSL